MGYPLPRRKPLKRDQGHILGARASRPLFSVRPHLLLMPQFTTTGSPTATRPSWLTVA